MQSLRSSEWRSDDQARLKARRSGRRAAFTLIELLVVIGIIGLLIATILAAVRSARARAIEVRCGQQLRTLVQSLRLRAADHKDFLPLAGTIRVSGFGPPLSTLLNDASKERYDYLRDAAFPGAERPLPWAAAIARYAGASADVRLHTGADLFNWAASTQSASVQLLMCPAADPATTSIPHALVSAADGNTVMAIYPIRQSYAVNTLAFGFDATSDADAATARLSRIDNPSQTLLLADSQDTGSTGLWWQPAPTTASPATLAALLDSTAASAFDRVRHRGRINLAFADGHVEARSIAKNDLRDVLLSTRR